MIQAKDRMVRIPRSVAVSLAWVTSSIAQRMIEMAVSGGLALLSVGMGRLLLDAACSDLGESFSEETDYSGQIAA